MGVAAYTFGNENSFFLADFQRGSNPADYGDAIAQYRRFFTIGVDGHSLTTPIPPSPPEHCGSSWAGRIGPPDLVDDDDARYASPHSEDVLPYASIRGRAL